MKDRALEIAAFLEQNGWGDAEAAPFNADFSPRRYARLTQSDGTTAILMDADTNQKTPSFVEIDELLRSLSLSAPEIYAAYPDEGLVLLEDFGRRNFGRLIDSGEDSKPLYRRAVDLLVELHKKFSAVDKSKLDLPAYGGALFASQVEMFLDDYIPYAKNREASVSEGEGFRAAWKQALRGIEALPQSLLLRDYMPDNLMDLPGREGVQSVGLLDFQDAGLGPAAYDIASLCEMVRRDGGDVVQQDMIVYYHAQMKPALSLQELTTACHILAAQRHMRILGIIVRVVNATGQKDKLQYMPRIWEYLHQLLQDEALRPVREWCEATGIDI